MERRNLMLPIRKSDSVDIMFLSEGTYPYVKGGVSSWMHQLISELPEFKFGIIFIGSQAKNYGEVSYQLPENIVHLETHYLFDENNLKPKARKGCPVATEVMKNLHRYFADKSAGKTVNPPAEIFSQDFFSKQLPLKDFLFSDAVWQVIKKYSQENAENLSFQDYFWTIRSIHQPIWKLAEILKKLPNIKLLHAPSTGYAGYLGAMISSEKKLPYLLTEHGIYTRERKIDLLSSHWLGFTQYSLLKEKGSLHYLKRIWVDFFKHIGELSYDQADKILSLFSEAKKIQINLGAPEFKTQVISNAVDVDLFSSLIPQRPDEPPQVVALIGRVVPIKDIKTFIRAILISTEKMPEIQGWIVGAFDEDLQYFSECKEMVKVLSLEKNIKFLGHQQLTDIFPQIGLSTLTSISEGMPLVMLESFAAGVPCIVTDVGSCAELIHGGLDEEDIALGSAGGVTKIASTLDLANYYVNYLSDINLWHAAQQVALKRVNKYYRKEKFLTHYRDLYLEYLNKSDLQ
jgi:glycosyltransferase involved in cell wall biosynthesis